MGVSLPWNRSYVFPGSLPLDTAYNTCKHCAVSQVTGINFCVGLQEARELNYRGAQTAPVGAYSAPQGQTMTM